VKTTSQLTITEVAQDFVVSFINDGDWDKVYAYTWTGEDPSKTEFNGSWPGDDACLEKSLTTQKFNGVDHYVYTYTYTGVTAPENIIFSNGSGAQTADLKFVDGAEYSFNLAPVYAVIGDASTVFAANWDAAGTTDWLTDADADGVYTLAAPKFNVALTTTDIEYKVIKKAYKEATAVLVWYPAGDNEKIHVDVADNFNVDFNFNLAAGTVATNIIPATEGLSVGASGWATAVTTQALNFEGFSGLTAYVAKVADSKVTLTPVTSAPVGTPLVLKGDNKTHNVPTKFSADVVDNDLQGSAVYNFVITDEMDAAFDFYGLVINGSDKAQFTKLNKGTIDPGKAYLKIAKGSSARAALDVVFADETTGINAVENAVNNGVYYNLQGVRVAQPTKGLYIVNGKKVILK
jgi:hypothetical protein